MINKLLISFPGQTRARTSSTVVRANVEHRSQQMLRAVWFSVRIFGLQEPAFRVYVVEPTVSLFQLWDSPQPATLLEFLENPPQETFPQRPMHALSPPQGSQHSALFSSSLYQGKARLYRLIIPYLFRT